MVSERLKAEERKAILLSEGDDLVAAVLDDTDAEIAALNKRLAATQEWLDKFQSALGQEKADHLLEIAALKAQMSSMVTLDQVEKVFAEWLQEDDASIASLIKTFSQEVNAELKRLGGSPFGASITHDSGAVPLFMERLRQSTPTDAAKPAKWSAQYTAQQIWDAVHDHCKYTLSIGRTDAPEDLADEVMDLLVVRSRSTPTEKE